MTVFKHSLLDLVAVVGGMAYYTNIKSAAVRKEGISMYFSAGEYEFATGVCGFNFGLLAAAPTRDGRPPFLIVNPNFIQSVKFRSEFPSADRLEIKEVGFNLFGNDALTIEIFRMPPPFCGIKIMMNGFLEDISRIGAYDDQNKKVIIGNKADWHFEPYEPIHTNPEWDGRYRLGELVTVGKLMERKLEIVILAAEGLPIHLSDSAKKFLKEKGGE